jgi:hypothetical protein
VSTEPIRFATPSRPRLDLLEPARDEHVWVVVAAYRVSLETLRAAQGEQMHLDRENLATIEVGCFICEQGYSERLSYRKCSGEPS